MVFFELVNHIFRALRGGKVETLQRRSPKNGCFDANVGGEQQRRRKQTKKQRGGWKELLGHGKKTKGGGRKKPLENRNGKVTDATKRHEWGIRKKRKKNDSLIFSNSCHILSFVEVRKRDPGKVQVKRETQHKFRQQDWNPEEDQKKEK